MTWTHLAWSRTLAACAVALATTAVWAADGAAPAAGEEGYVQIAPQGYSFGQDQGFVQRYRGVDPKDDGRLDRALEIFDQVGLAIFPTRSGAPVLELYHGAALHLEANDAVSVAGFARWSTRRNETPVATAAVEARHFLLRDRNLSTPLVRRMETSSLFGGSSLIPTVQMFAGAQMTRREQDSHLVLANVRRWREGWVGEVFDPAFGYESEARHPPPARPWGWAIA